jgi:hypothetical protein
MAVEMALAEKLADVFNSYDDCGSAAVIGRGCAGPVDGGISPDTQWELDLRDWGVVYGLAVGIARCEEPFESIQSVTARALEAARVVYADQWDPWTGSAPSETAVTA